MASKIHYQLKCLKCGKTYSVNPFTKPSQSNSLYCYICLDKMNLEEAPELKRTLAPSLPEEANADIRSFFFPLGDGWISNVRKPSKNSGKDNSTT